jgi:hypothetical protein
MIPRMNDADVNAEIQRILASPEFANSGVLGPLLRAAVRGDKIAGAEARELRARLIAYYAGPGKSDPVVIELSEDTEEISISINKPAAPGSPQGYQPSMGRKLFFFFLCLLGLIIVWVVYFTQSK